MGYVYELKKYYKVKNWIGASDEFKRYPWPCDKDTERHITIRQDDIFTINSEENGICNVIKHNGISAFGILIPKKDLEEYNDTIQIGVL